MWNGRELKEKGKAAMKANYGITLVVSLLLTVVSGAASGGSMGSSAGNSASESAASFQELGLDPELVSALVLTILGAILVAAIISLVLDILVFNPLEVGCQNFFLKNTDGPAELGDLVRGFKPSWKNNVITLLLRDIFLILWSCLFLIPGIVKGYSYRLVPYIMAENPDMKGTEAITLSRELMNGNKWKAFCFDLSFFGWFLLSIITCGLVGVFYVMPYYNCSCAELYKAIRDERSISPVVAEQ